MNMYIYIMYVFPMVIVPSGRRHGGGRDVEEADHSLQVSGLTDLPYIPG